MFKDWNWTPRAYEIWWMIKFTFYGLVTVAMFVLADWIGRSLNG